MIFIDYFKKRKQKEQLLEESQVVLNKSIEKSSEIQKASNEVQKANNDILKASNNVQKANIDIQKSIMEIAWKNQELNEKLTQLVLENERKENILLERENRIKAKQDELDERQKEVRREEIGSTARKAEIRKEEQLVAEQQKTFDAEGKRIVERETEAEKLKMESENEKEKYEKLYEELEVDKDNINTLEEAARRKNEDANEKTAAANSIFEKAKVIDEEIKAKEAKFEEHRQEIEKALNEKIEEYDRRLEDLNAVKGIADDVKFDKSKEGKEAKIVVKEAIRQAKKALTDIKTKFEELDEKYSSGTFKGFSTPLSEIDKYFEELKTQYIQVKEHITGEENLPPSVSKWLNSIEECINNADKFIKSWEFSEAYRNIVWGLSTCRNYELLLAILNDFAGASTNDAEQSEEEHFDDWYEILEVEPDAIEKEIKKAYREIAKKYHPDKNNGDKESEEKFKKAAEAYENLSNPEKRKTFDEKRNYRKQKK
jgi:DNA repair exonuclease SbcCD ATPase subunit